MSVWKDIIDKTRENLDEIRKKNQDEALRQAYLKAQEISTRAQREYQAKLAEEKDSLDKLLASTRSAVKKSTVGNPGKGKSVGGKF